MNARREAFLAALPCRNFCILGADYIPLDPLSGKERFAVVSYAGGATGALILVDPETKTCENYPLPYDAGAWAALYLKEKEMLLIGTCANHGALHRFDLKTRTYLSSLTVEGERYIWNLARGDNGRIYGGTWPGGALLEYDPEKETLVSLGHVGPDKENCYTKNVTPVCGGVAVNSGFHENTVWLYTFANQKFMQIGGAGESIAAAFGDCLLTKTDTAYRLYDIKANQFLAQFAFDEQPENLPNDVKTYLEKQNEPLPYGLLPGEAGNHIVTRKNGKRIGIKGQDLIWEEDDGWHFELLAAEPIPCNIMTLAADPDGLIWGSAEFGQTIFSYDPKTDTFENSASVAAAGGEVYGIVPLDGRLYLTSYIHGDHILYDPKTPWDQYNNINPRLLGSCAPKMVRPHGKSVLGADGNIWTGWWASYGVRGGGITKIDTKTQKITSWFGIAGDQAIEHLCAAPEYLYAVTNGEASGLMADRDTFRVLKIAYEGKVVGQRVFDKGVLFFKILYIQNRLVVSRTKSDGTPVLSVLDPDTLETRCETPLIGKTGMDAYNDDCIAHELLDLKNGLCAVFTGKMIDFFNPETNRFTEQFEAPGLCRTATLAPDGTIWFAVGEKLYRL
ncbi:hypothetical protein [Hominenteromicrobium sp.]|uniref:hypothetical protein n=1 Tax=Hominenteromicrobium sp. TaxID=3073581 RepID=UPI003AB112DC